MSGVWEPTSPALDRPRGSTPIRASYVVCSTPRSGSGLLCRAMASTGGGGVPAEYFNARQREPLARRWACGDGLDAYVAELRARRTDATGVFGVKVHRSQLDALCRERARAGQATTPVELLQQLVPGATLIHIVRLDLDLQAVSLWRAEETGVWARRAGEPAGNREPRVLAGGRVEALRRQLLEDEAAWTRVLVGWPGPTCRVVYEHLQRDLAVEAATVLETVGVRIDPARVAPPDSVRQADERSVAWARQLRERRRRVGRVDRALRAGARRLRGRS